MKKPLTQGQVRFIKNCEDNAGEYKREGETQKTYLDRLRKDYGPLPKSTD